MRFIQNNPGDILGNGFVFVENAPRRLNKSKTYLKVLCAHCKKPFIGERSAIISRLKSCGCLNRMPKDVSAGQDGIQAQLEYSCLKAMRERVKNYNNRYPGWGGRGISICEEWKDSGVFIKWARENGYEHGLQIDRIDTNGNYEPSNCRFVTSKINNSNRRDTQYWQLDGVTMCEKDASVALGFYTSYLTSRRTKGYRIPARDEGRLVYLGLVNL